MKYRLEQKPDSYLDLIVEEGPVWVAFLAMHGFGYQIEKVETGQTWWEGNGEELIGVEDSAEKAEELASEYWNRK